MLQGEINVQNMSVNADLLMTTLSNSLTEHWWEYYWITNTIIFAADQRQYFKAELKFYILSVSNLQKNSKKSQQ